MEQNNRNSKPKDIFQRTADALFGGNRKLTLVLFWVGMFTIPWISVLGLTIFGIIPALREQRHGSRSAAPKTRQSRRTKTAPQPTHAAGGQQARYAQPQGGAALQPRPAPQKPAAPSSKIPKPRHIGHADADKMLDAGYDFLVKCEEYMPEIDDLEVRAKVKEAGCKVQGIMDWVRTQPESAKNAKRMAGYYLPTVQRLLHTYISVDNNPGPNAQEICRQISHTLDTLNQALANLRDDLLGNTALNVEAEIAAMEQMLGSEGLTDELRMPGPGEP